MRAFHNEPAIKSFYLARVQAHRQADQLIHGAYWSEGKGCAVAATRKQARLWQSETLLALLRAAPVAEEVS